MLLLIGVFWFSFCLCFMFVIVFMWVVSFFLGLFILVVLSFGWVAFVCGFLWFALVLAVLLCCFLFDWMSLVYVGVVRRGVSLVVFVMIPFVGLFFCFSGVCLVVGCVFRRVGICFVCVGALRGLFILAVVLWFWFDRPVFFAFGFALADLVLYL